MEEFQFGDLKVINGVFLLPYAVAGIEDGILVVVKNLERGFYLLECVGRNIGHLGKIVEIQKCSYADDEFIGGGASNNSQDVTLQIAVLPPSHLFQVHDAS